MKVKIIVDNGNYAGYDLIPETEEDHNNLGAIRNMIFFGHGDQAIKYAGRDMKKKGSYESEDIERLKFRTVEFKKKKLKYNK